MTTLELFEELLRTPAHRDLTRALLAALYELRGLALIVGEVNGHAASRLATLAAAHWPVPHVNLVRIDANPTRISMAGSEARVVENAGTEVALRSALRQDPDVIVLTALEDAAAQMVLAAAQTGHAVLLATKARDSEEVLRALGGGEDGLELVIELGDDAKLKRILWRGGELAAVSGDEVVLKRALLPPPVEPLARVAPLSMERRPAEHSIRRAWLPVTGEGASRSALGTNSALRPQGTNWPACKSCSNPLQLVVQLELATLPVDFGAPRGLAQLFVCSAGCDTTNETAPGVLAEILTTESLVTVTSPASQVVVAPGNIIDWRAIDEEPSSDDFVFPLRVDKLGGWPAWEQGDEWPPDDDGTPMTLLFQIVEGETRVGGTPARWSFDDAALIPGTPSERVLDADRPRHFPALLTGEASAFLFIAKSGRLAFRWQTG